MNDSSVNGDIGRHATDSGAIHGWSLALFFVRHLQHSGRGAKCGRMLPNPVRCSKFSTSRVCASNTIGRSLLSLSSRSKITYLRYRRIRFTDALNKPGRASLTFPMDQALASTPNRSSAMQCERIQGKMSDVAWYKSIEGVLVVGPYFETFDTRLPGTD
jgi:hypothetical protein